MVLERTEKIIATEGIYLIYAVITMCEVYKNHLTRCA